MCVCMCVYIYIRFHSGSIKQSTFHSFRIFPSPSSSSASASASASINRQLLPNAAPGNMVTFSKPQAAAVASKAVNYWRTLANARGYTTSTAPKARSVASIADDGLLRPLRTSKPRGDYVPVYVALGLIVLSTSFGLYTAKQQLAHAPNVLVDKKKRETIPEVVDPDWAVAEAGSFISKSIFRKIAHLQDFDAVRAGISDPTRAPASGHLPVKAETLKDVGVEPPGIERSPSLFERIFRRRTADQ